MSDARLLDQLAQARRRVLDTVDGRAVVFRVLTETTTHAGQLDIFRELLAR